MVNNSGYMNPANAMGSEYNLKGEEGGLDWERIIVEHDAREDPERLERGDLRAKEIKARARKQYSGENTALERAHKRPNSFELGGEL
jgi:hypothetical protein